MIFRAHLHNVMKKIILFSLLVLSGCQIPQDIRDAAVLKM